MGLKSAIKFPFKEGSHGGEMLQSLSLIAQNAFLLFIGQNLLVLKAPTTSPICWTPPRQTKKLDPSFSRPQIRYSSAVHIGELPGSCYRAIATARDINETEIPRYGFNRATKNRLRADIINRPIDISKLVHNINC